MSGTMSPLVSVDWLAAHGDDVVLLDATIDRGVDAAGKTTFKEGQGLYAAAHIPGARFADLFEAFSEPDSPFLFTCPTAERLRAAARAVGISNDSTIVVYDSLSGAWAARVWWVLRSFGLDSVYVLDGGLRAWTASGRPPESGSGTLSWAEGTFVARPRDGFFVDIAEVKRIALGPVRDVPLVCATRRVEYLGQASDGPRAGHIPGSVSLPYPDLLDENGLVDATKGEAAWRALGLAGGARPILYCGGGINAAGLALVLTAAGLQGLTIFDGSLNEWRADATLPMATGEEA